MCSSDLDFSTTLRKDVQSLLVDTSNTETDPEHKVMCIWGMCTLVYEDLTHTPSTPMIKEIIRTLIPSCLSDESLVSRAALDSLSTLSMLFSELNALEESPVNLIVEFLCSNIHSQIVQSKQSKTYVLNENLVADHFYCLLDWVMSSERSEEHTSELQSRQSISYAVFCL